VGTEHPVAVSAVSCETHALRMGNVLTFRRRHALLGFDMSENLVCVDWHGYTRKRRLLWRRSAFSLEDRIDHGALGGC
jgi:hypothetical protein